MSEPTTPFISLGKHLKYLREQVKQSMAEVSGAVEIDELALQRIEEGLARPSEDILLLLISHFAMPDQEAVQLWEMAGYDGDIPSQIQPTQATTSQKPAVILLAMDARTMYSDGLEINADHAGMILNFTQSTGQTDSPIARIGMSYDQAQEVLNAIQKELLKSKYLNGTKALPPSQNLNDDKPSKNKPL